MPLETTLKGLDLQGTLRKCWGVEIYSHLPFDNNFGRFPEKKWLIYVSIMPIEVIKTDKSSD